MHTGYEPHRTKINPNVKTAQYFILMTGASPETSSSSTSYAQGLIFYSGLQLLGPNYCAFNTRKLSHLQLH